MQASVMLVHVMTLMVLAAAGLPAHHQLEPRQSSDGCGPNPLVAVISYAREFGNYTSSIIPKSISEFFNHFNHQFIADFSPQQLMRFIEMDTRAGSQLRTLLRTYDDCVRTGDGARYKKSSNGEMNYEQIDSSTTNNGSQRSLQQANQSLLRALMVDP